jgi:geranylgeranyl diphosphate synthase type I
VAGAEAEQVAKLGEFGRNLGIAFQLQDDILGIFGDPKITGKGDGDLARRKKTLPVLRTLERDPSLREIYFGSALLDIAQMKEKIEGLGGRAFTDTLAKNTYDAAISALKYANLKAESAELLNSLAVSLIGRNY